MLLLGRGVVVGTALSVDVTIAVGVGVPVGIAVDVGVEHPSINPEKIASTQKILFTIDREYSEIHSRVVVRHSCRHWRETLHCARNFRCPRVVRDKSRAALPLTERFLDNLWSRESQTKQPRG